jgi:hypothetical protein
VDVQAGMPPEEAPDVAAPVDGTPVPEHIDRAPQVAQQVTEEGLDVEASESAGAAVEIERELAPARRDTASPLQTERRSWRYRWCRYGVSPRGVQVRRTLGISRKPLSSTNTRWAPR